MSDSAALCYGSWRQVKPAIRSFVFSLSCFFFEERGENIKTLHLIYFVRPCYYFPNPMGFYRFLSAPSIEKNRKQQEHAQWMTVNETKVLFAEKTCHKNLLPGLQIPYKFFPKSFLMLFKAIFRLRNILPHKSIEQLCSTSRKPVSDWLHSFHG